MIIFPRRHDKTSFHERHIESYIQHYGIPRKSGRYPWGSGEDPYQSERSFLGRYEELKKQGLNERDIAEKLNMNTTQLRNNITWARKEQRAWRDEQITIMKEQGLSNTEIGKRLGMSEASVRNYISPRQKTQTMQLDNISKSIEQGVNNTGYLDVGVGVERQLGISRTKFNAVVNKLKEQGYYIHEVYVRRLSDPSKWTTVKVLTKESDREVVTKDSTKIRHLDTQSDDNGLTISNIDPPKHINMDRIMVRYAEDGGADKDGLIEMRQGVPDLDLGNSKYAQVRIAAGEDLFMKGMAVYEDDKSFPPGKDIIYNVTKSKGTPDREVFKVMKEDADNPFGTNIVRQKGALNIVNEQGDWDTWSTKMSSQFLSKQPLTLIQDRLEATSKALKSEYDEIISLTNPVVKKHLLDAYIDGLDAKARHLKAQGLPRTKNHVILPIKDIKPNEIYAPNYNDGERVVLVRHPHGGTFEIPDLIVNNRNKTGRSLITNKSPDAVGIHPSVAEKLSGADFDGDTVLVIPNGKGQIKTSRSLKELKGWSDQMHVLYKRDHKTIQPRTKEIQMGVVSNLITDMTIKGASDSEIARAVKHSMVVIDSEKHNLDYKQSARDNGITALRRKYQTRINPDTGKKGMGASTIISRSKRKVDISDPDFDPSRYSSGTASEELYVRYIRDIQTIKNEASKVSQTIKRPEYSREAAKIYAPEVQSLNKKLNEALLNKPRERQAQILTNNLYYTSLTPDMTPDDKKKLRARSLARARETTGAKRANINITDKEWEAIQARAVSSTRLDQILENTNMDRVKELAAPRQSKLTTAKASRALSLLNNGYTYAEVANVMGVSTSTIRTIIEEG